MLEVTGVCKRFDGRLVLDDVSLRVDAGEVVCLLGANGAGKTTTLNVLLGFLAVDAGEVRIAGQSAPRELARARQRLGYVPEVVQLYPTLDALETLEYFADMADVPRPDAATAASLLSRVGLQASAHGQRVATYSKGMRQKLALALALVKQAQALLLDEPLSGLDPQAANDFVADMREAASAGMAVLMVTHDVLRAAQVADRIGIMRGGKLIAMLDAREMSGADLERIYIEHLRDVKAS